MKRKRSKPNSGKLEQQALLSTAEACRRRYRHYPDVIGIGAGLKFVQGRSTGETCIHFYVRRKKKRITARRKLPQFVYSRHSDGTIDFSHKFTTDVIELRRPRFTCKAGTEIGVIGESGTITLLFQNHSPGDSDYYLITCAHVAGDVRKSFPVDPSITSSCCIRSDILASTIVNSTEQSGEVKFDIALARLTSLCSPQDEHQVVGSNVKLRRFLPASDIRPGMRVDCAFPISNVLSATVSSLRTSLPLLLDGQEYQVNNLFLIDQTPRKGDSGGLLYDGVNAVGILVGMSDGWGLFQPLEEAFHHLEKISPISIKCF